MLLHVQDVQKHALWKMGYAVASVSTRLREATARQALNLQRRTMLSELEDLD